MVNEKEETRIFTLEEVAALRQHFRQMIEGQGVAFYVVDSGATNRRMTAAALQKSGFECVYEMKAPDEALAAIAKDPSPRIVTFVDDVLDTAAGGIDCMTYLKKFKQMRPDGVCFLTGTRFTPAKIIDVVNFGGAAVFPRPLNFEEITAKLNALGVRV